MADELPYSDNWASACGIVVGGSNSSSNSRQWRRHWLHVSAIIDRCNLRDAFLCLQRRAAGAGWPISALRSTPPPTHRRPSGIVSAINARKSQCGVR